ncbi:hypothetical protein [Sphingopyxis sp.]|uniref:hypothetical protein n=1 Tax=Sphingopyxis sp. TaxID=1908224 RepID=UPI002D794EB5|nr:hypothetical protein [Sphingopyxis sp.]HET6524683.1 hypothetical protein [Sphingopyxis sp.]
MQFSLVVATLILGVLFTYVLTSKLLWGRALPKSLSGAIGLTVGAIILIAFFDASWWNVSPSLLAALFLLCGHLIRRRDQNDASQKS